MNPISEVRSDTRSNHANNGSGLSRGLGLLGVGLGVTERAFPRTVRVRVVRASMRSHGVSS